MRAAALVVPRTRGEEVRRRLVDAGRLRTDLRIAEVGSTIVFPLVEGAPLGVEFGRQTEAEFDARPDPPASDYRALIAATEEERALLPRSFDVVGEIVVIRLPPEWRARRAEIGAALLEFVPRARLVGWDQGVHGEERRRTLERIAGDGPWTTIHRENGIDFSVDLEAAYFSPRLAREHARVAATVREGATVYDLACGVGPFSVQIARDGRAGGIVALDANPAAIRLLRATLGRLPYGGRVTAVEDRIEAFLPGRAPCDLAVLNLPHEGIKYAPSVARAVAPGGRFSYYEIVARSDQPRRGNVVADALGPAGRWTVAETHVVHPYSPDADLVGFTFDRATE